MRAFGALLAALTLAGCCVGVPCDHATSTAHCSGDVLVYCGNRPVVYGVDYPAIESVDCVAALGKRCFDDGAGHAGCAALPARPCDPSRDVSHCDGTSLVSCVSEVLDGPGVPSVYLLETRPCFDDTTCVPLEHDARCVPMPLSPCARPDPPPGLFCAGDHAEGCARAADGRLIVTDRTMCDAGNLCLIDGEAVRCVATLPPESCALGADRCSADARYTERCFADHWMHLEDCGPVHGHCTALAAGGVACAAGPPP